MVYDSGVRMELLENEMKTAEGKLKNEMKTGGQVYGIEC